MKLSAILVAASLALVPMTAATASLANDAKKEALKKAKEQAKEEAKEKARAKTEAVKAAAASRAAASSSRASAAPAVDPAAVQRERETHARNLGVLERLQQIATSTNDSDLKVTVIRLNGKEDRRHAMAVQLNGG